MFLQKTKRGHHELMTHPHYMSEDEIQAIKMGVRRPPFAFTEQGVSQF